MTLPGRPCRHSPDLEKGGKGDRFLFHAARTWSRLTRGSTSSRRMPRTLRLSGKSQPTRAEKAPGSRVGRRRRDECRSRCACPVNRSLRVRRRPPAHAWVDVVATNAAHAALVRKTQLTRASTLTRHPARPSRQTCRPPKARKVGHGKTTCPLFQVRRRSRPP